MATTTTADVTLSALPPVAGRAGLRGTLASEWTKLRSVRSTYWTIAALVIVSVGLAAAIGAGAAADLHSRPGDKAGFDATKASLVVFYDLGQLIIVVIGAMVITTEYSTGMIRTSLTAMPRRGVVYLAKAVVFFLTALVVSLVTSFLAFFIGQLMLSGTGFSASLFHSFTVPRGALVTPQGATLQGTITISPGTVLIAVAGTALYVTVAAMIAFGIGAIIRHTAGVIASAIALLFIVPFIADFLPYTWHSDMIRFLPSSAGGVISSTVGSGGAHLWSAWPQLLVTVAWAVALVAIGGYLFRKRDA